MGALHAGHISLIEECKRENAVTVCSIFVNPTQFNNPADFEKYPITIESDIDKLEAAGCDILFLPSVTEIYPPGMSKSHYDLGYLETVLEGHYRPGHFQGVCMVVDRLLSIVQPTMLYLGQKDYQQCMVISKLVALKNFDTTIRISATIRETDGLAMSSRNVRLNEQERKQALNIYAAMNMIKNEMVPGKLQALKEKATRFLTEHGFKVDYVDIANAKNLALLEEWDGRQKVVVLVAAYLQEVRLIDNLLLN
jgi:pantoate--beta-alanine ligase